MEFELDAVHSRIVASGHVVREMLVASRAVLERRQSLLADCRLAEPQSLHQAIRCAAFPLAAVDQIRPDGMLEQAQAPLIGPHGRFGMRRAAVHV